MSHQRLRSHEGVRIAVSPGLSAPIEVVLPRAALQRPIAEALTEAVRGIEGSAVARALTSLLAGPAFVESGGRFHPAGSTSVSEVLATQAQEPQPLLRVLRPQVGGRS